MYQTGDLHCVWDHQFSKYNQYRSNDISAGTIRIAAAKIKPANKFLFDGKHWSATNHPAYSISSLLNVNPGNEELISLLTQVQQELKDNLQPLNSFYMPVPETFHQTIAGMLPADRLAHSIPAYVDIINNAFTKISLKKLPHAVCMRLTGLAIFDTFIAMVGIFDNESDYNRIRRFRDDFYSNEKLAALGIARAIPFVGQIIIAYAEQKLNKNQKEHLAATINDINENIRVKRKYFEITKAALYRHENPCTFSHESNFPVYSFSL